MQNIKNNYRLHQRGQRVWGKCALHLLHTLFWCHLHTLFEYHLPISSSSSPFQCVPTPPTITLHLLTHSLPSPPTLPHTSPAIILISVSCHQFFRSPPLLMWPSSVDAVAVVVGVVVVVWCFDSVAGKVMEIKPFVFDNVTNNNHYDKVFLQ